MSKIVNAYFFDFCNLGEFFISLFDSCITQALNASAYTKIIRLTVNGLITFLVFV